MKGETTRTALLVVLWISLLLAWHIAGNQTGECTLGAQYRLDVRLLQIAVNRGNDVENLQ